MKISRSKISTLSLAMVATAALSLGLATPTQADTTKDGCTVGPGAPEFRETFTAGAVPEVYYPVEVSCDASASGLDVEVKIETWEQDLAGTTGDVDANGVNNADEDRIGSGNATRSFGVGGGSTTIDFLGVLPHTDTDFDEEVYQKVKFRVTSGPVTGRWTDLEFSTVSTIGW